MVSQRACMFCLYFFSFFFSIFICMFWHIHFVFTPWYSAFSFIHSPGESFNYVFTWLIELFQNYNLMLFQISISLLNSCFMSCIDFFFCGTGVWTQGLHLDHSTSPILVKGFGDRVSWTICLGCLRTSILLIFASRVARIKA
jgi:hypothetical protein